MESKTKLLLVGGLAIMGYNFLDGLNSERLEAKEARRAEMEERREERREAYIQERVDGKGPGFEAGYRWAREKNITDPNDCSGNSVAFMKGCVLAATDFAEPDYVEPPEVDYDPYDYVR